LIAGTYDNRLRPTPLETAAGMLFGPDPGADPLPTDVAVTPHEALRDAIRTALRRPPCIVAFSGGRDSSALLALAVDVARKDGLPLPIPVTMRFPGVADADETQWQELVVQHLDLDDWVRLDFADELDFVGPWAQQVLRRHGVLWPANDYVDMPLLQQASSGSFIDGVDGDSVFRSNYQSLMQTLRGRRLPGRAALRDLRFLLKSKAARHAHARHLSPSLPWLTPAAQREMSDLIAADYVTEPLSYAKRLGWYHGSRYMGAMQWTTEVFAAEAGVAVVRPLLDSTFLAALGKSLGALGFNGRGHMMRWLFGDVLPRAAVERVSKASFPHYWGAASSELASQWQGEGIDPAYVDHDALREAWAADRVDHRSALLLQSVWLTRNSSLAAS
jgi:asparagine synthase (glutamine-hydrolysing)